MNTNIFAVAYRALSSLSAISLLTSSATSLTSGALGSLLSLKQHPSRLPIAKPLHSLSALEYLYLHSHRAVCLTFIS